MTRTILTRVRPWGGAPADVIVDGGAITGVAAPGAADTTSATVVDGRDRILLPSFADVHVHLDSTRIGLPFRPHTGSPGVWGMMLNDRRNWRHAEAPIEARVATTLERAIARGTTAVRTYAQVDTDAGLERLDAVLTVREANAGRCDVEVIAFPQAGLLREAGSADVLDQAMARGADVVGGIDPCALDRDPVRHLDMVFGIAEKYAAPIDIHLHEPDQLARFSTELIIERTRALGMQGRVTISHGYGLGRLPEAQLRPLLDELRDLDISMATIAPPTPLPTLMLAEYGIRLGLGQDGQRDYWSPYGNTDMLDRTWQLAFTNGFRRDEDIEHCVAIATVGGRAVMGRAAGLAGAGDRPGLQVGDPADLVLVAGDTVTAAVMDRSPDRTVLYRGVVVADGLELTGEVAA
ncbi:amidohydrolase family protein [Microbacterium imperiale]|uniref:Cytosine deaminase n=1 Tax=Microbacterium imperiale TaxID=33884 RepID=A0A9W6HHN2_9MICO|nr:amidohydrolase family protein [Microbacterium imperiale]MBP2421384.1 cytosine/adenosine deaminase-related metal-dependent hydrolase [Microbacterium imperiale]MDS0199509.1 amidohydrolase family protein [Microbacterium imperiale]BFE41723.1 amidohydrolase [Microbacterium imperiale]GLJ80675.1 cytosine deaminase [Microbacterium imperiale]